MNGHAGFLFDSNVLLDLTLPDPVWLAWSQEQVQRAARRGPMFVNPVIYAEVAPAFQSAASLERWFNTTVFRRLPLPYTAAWRAAEAFIKYRRAGGARVFPLPDFYIGAHAEAEGLTLVTRDAARFRTYFPDVTLIAPAV